MTCHEKCDSKDFFYPPLWRQRRIFIQDTLERFNVETVLDYGCGEAAVLSCLIPPTTKNIITRMAGIDICEQVLQEAIDRCVPYKLDYENKRLTPLHIDIFLGSVGDPDDRLKGYQAIICSEVIEHVYPDVLDKVLGITLGIYKPEILILTTPNAEYNVNFPNLKYKTKDAMFRHDDHKFEWTRKEFKRWCDDGAEKYGYKTEYHGVGLLHGREDEVENGHCTQACLFIRPTTVTSNSSESVTLSHGTPHTLAKEIDFPYFDEELPAQDKILEELVYFIQILCEAECCMRNEVVPAKAKADRRAFHETKGDDDLDINNVIDWNSFNLDDYNISKVNNNGITEKKKEFTIAPLSIPLSSLWNIARVQHICQSMKNLSHLLALLKKDDYELIDNNDKLHVKKTFEII